MGTPASPVEVVQSLITQFAAFQAALLIASGLHKLFRSDRLQRAAREFAGVPARLAPTAVVAAAAAELLAGISLWTPSLRAAGACLAALIWGGYLLLMLRAIALDRRSVDCGCSFGPTQRPLGAYQLVRNAVLTGTALLVAADSAASSAGGVPGSQWVAAFAMLALYGALEQVMGLMPPRAGELL